MLAAMPYLGGFPYAGYGYVGGVANLTETSPEQTFTEPLSLDEVKNYLKVPFRSPADSAEDDLIQSMIVGARAKAEIEQHRDLVVKQIDLQLDYWPACGVIEVGSPLISVDLLQYKDSDGTVTPMALGTNYIIDFARQPGLICAPYNVVWPSFTPWPLGSILVRFTCGYPPTHPWWSGSVGSIVKRGMMLQISQWYHERFPDAMTQQNQEAVDSLLSYGGRRSVY